MSDRNEQNRQGRFGRDWNDERWGWGRGLADDERRWRGEGREAQYSSDYDETLGSEWERGREPSYDQGGSGNYGRGGYGGDPNYGRGGYGESRGRGYYRGGNAGMYGGGYRGRDFGSLGGSSGSPRYAGGYGFGGGAGSSGFGGNEGMRRGGYAGRGPKGYTRTDDRIREEVCERLSRDDDVDASEIEVRVQNGEVTLEGTVQTRSMKHQAEDLAEDVSGVTDVHNRLRVMKSMFNEIKDKVTGKDDDAHYANTGTKNEPASTSAGRNGTM
ncbi:MAG TPA: BON domain-containing protein [Polyangiaceae bacterium]|nr:BON domain-containing protein [Polyangiaceae bacterium]